MSKPNPHVPKMLTLYGENFSKTDPVNVFFGSDPSPFTEVRCTEVIGCLPPEMHSTRLRPIFLVRSDGVVFPSNVMYP
jgi:recombining binding protein (suppressor of hairless)